MLRFVVRRLLLLVPILLGLSILVFLWIRALPGDPASALLGERATAARIAEVRHRYGLDRPIFEQYWDYLKTTASGDLGQSIASRRSVMSEIRQRFPATLQLAIVAMIFALGVGLPLGFLAAKWHGSVFDHLSLVGSLIGISIPIFFLAVILKYIFSVKLGWLPSIGQISVTTEMNHPTNFYLLDAIIEWRWDAFWDVTQAPDPARDRARLDPAGDHHADHPRVGARRAERGLRPHGAREGPLAADRRLAARAAERDAADLDHHRPADRACCSPARC